MRELVISPTYDALQYDFEREVAHRGDAGWIGKLPMLQIIAPNGDRIDFKHVATPSDTRKVAGIVYDSLRIIQPLDEDILRLIRPWIRAGRPGDK